MSRASRTVMKPAPLLLLSPLTTTKGFSLMPYSLYLRRTLVSSASAVLCTHSSPLASDRLTSPQRPYIGLISHGSMPSSLANFLATSS
jgi:hypothetical protein